MRHALLLATCALALTWGAAAHAEGPPAGEYICTKLKGAFFPCTPVHLFLEEGQKWKWGPKHTGSYTVQGSALTFTGPKRGPVVWGVPSYEGEKVIFTDKKVSVIFTRKAG